MITETGKLNKKRKPIGVPLRRLLSLDRAELVKINGIAAPSRTPNVPIALSLIFILFQSHNVLGHL